ncbi:myopalladin isoform X2 [Patella vulgata]|uniref:myopalladin isoform X2 n=1 Tax=Patella vulgata TaxID=6465 RepID=UPI00217F4CD6|nr:myopalladin isoform X2 [Patella vulgata]
MADLGGLSEEELDELDIDELLARVERKPLTFSRTKSLNQAPEFSKRLSGEDTVDEGGETVLTCVVLGFPRPQLFWYKDADQIHPDHPRMRVEEQEGGVYTLTIKNVSKGDEAGYKCKAVNIDGETASTFFLFVKQKPKKGGSRGKKRRRVSYPPMFATIVEKVEEEERAAKEARYAPPSPLSELYVGITLKSRHTWPKFLGEWAFAEDAVRSCSDCSLSEEGDDLGDGRFIEGQQPDDVFHQGSGEHLLCSSTNQFYLGEIEDNEEIKITPRSSVVKNNNGSNVSAESKNEINASKAEEPNNNQPTSPTKTLTKPNNLSLTPNNGPLIINSSRSVPNLVSKCRNGIIVHANSTTTTTSTALTDTHSHGNTQQCTLTTNANLAVVARRRPLHGRMFGEGTLKIHFRECVLVLIVFTFLSLCFGMSCGRFVITVFGLHIIYAVSKNLIEK